jgi:hypothetical protein
MKRFRVGILGILLLLLWAVPATAGAQTPPSPAPSTQSKPTLPVDVNLNKIRTALQLDPGIRFDENQIRFYVDVYGHQTRFWDFIGTFDLKNGPTPHAGMTHQDFVNMVTPKDLYSSAGFTASEMTQLALTNVVGHYVLRKLIEELKNTRDERQAQRIRAQIDRELAALAGK